MPNALIPQYGWNERAGRYVSLPSRKFVPWERVGEALEDVIEVSRVEVETLTLTLVRGGDLNKWREAVAYEIKQMHIASACLGRGGYEQMTPADWGRVGQRIRRQYAYLENFARQVESGAQPMDGSLVNRARLYTFATRGTYDGQRRANYATMGYRFEKRVLHKAEHCQSCKDIAALGWQPIGTLPNIGDADCLSNCQCTFKFKK